VKACVQAVLEAASRPLADWVVFSGSLPQGMPVDTYDSLARRLKAMGCRIALDSAGPALAAGLRACVDLVKPSLDELREATGKPLTTLTEQSEAAQAWIRMRTSAVVVLSLGADGALLATRDGAWQVPAVPVDVVGTTGAGDSLLAAMLWCLTRGQHPREAVRWGVAAGAATVTKPASALADRQDIERLLLQVPAPRPC
jgi:6-phosphofructokinase 2